MTKRVIITGLAGQDAAYVAQQHLAAGAEVWGVVGRGRSLDGAPLDQMGLADAVRRAETDLDSPDEIRALLQRVAPDAIFNLAGQSSVAKSFVDPTGTIQANAMIPLSFLEALRLDGGQAALVQASTAEIFGSPSGVCDETTGLAPSTPYAAAKAFAHSTVGAYRAAYGVRASSAILFTHESPHRGAAFLTRKVTQTLAQIRHGLASVLELGNLSAERDWGFAGDYAAGMGLIAAAPRPDDFVLASGKARSVRDFVEAAARWFGYEIDWRGSGIEEVGVDRRSGQTLIQVNPAFFRPVDAPRLLGDARKAERELGWRRTVDFESLVGLMASADDERIRANLASATSR